MHVPASVHFCFPLPKENKNGAKRTRLPVGVGLKQKHVVFATYIHIFWKC